ncbi:NlpC/P60 family protein [Streptomyces qinglanensis]|uniref:C40 family peptidase n=1 Tax=Streptomyces qinglanensis TaxID=943816 RepID=UPI003D705C4A
MASHRKPAPRSFAAFAAFAAPAVRTALTLVLAGAAGATTMQGSGSAQPRTPQPDTTRVKAKVDRLHREAEQATEAYNGAREKARSAGTRLETLRDEAARRQQKLNASRRTLGSYAAAQYRDGSGVDPALRLVLTSAPEDYLERAAATERAGDRQAAAVQRAAHRSRRLAQLREEAAGVSTELAEAATHTRRHKRTVRTKLQQAQRLLGELTAEQRAAVLDEQTRTARARPHRPSQPSQPSRKTEAARGGGPAARPVPEETPGPAPVGRAARAVSFARSALGKPYVWGGTGPSGYDCSGLTQAAWRAAGVSLPRTTYSQIRVGRRVPRADLAPGDLVFFYDSISHVGLYVGGGRMIHAPRPGTAVRVAPIDQMPYAGAVRPA